MLTSLLLKLLFIITGSVVRENIILVQELAFKFQEAGNFPVEIETLICETKIIM